MSRPPDPAPGPQEAERIEALVAARVQQRLQSVGKVLLASQRAGCSVLESAAALGQLELLRQTLTIYQANRGDDEKTVLPDIRSDLRAATFAAATNGHSQCLQLLLDSCTSSPCPLTELLDARDAEEQTPLMISAEEGHVECMRLLLGHSPETQVAAVDQYGCNALMHAANHGHTACVRLLLAHSPHTQVQSVTPEGTSALIAAAISGHASCIPPLLAHSPDTQVAALGLLECTALMAAAGTGRTLCVQLLLAHSPDVQLAAVSPKGWTALSHAAAKAHVDCLQLLLARGPSQQQLDQALGEANQKMVQLGPPPGGQMLRLKVKKCIDLLLASGAVLPAQAQAPAPEGATAAPQPIIQDSPSQEQAARALVPDAANEAVAAAGCPSQEQAARALGPDAANEAVAAAGCPSQEQAARALGPDAANEAVAATGRKRQASGELEDAAAAGPSQRPRTSP